MAFLSDRVRLEARRAGRPLAIYVVAVLAALVVVAQIARNIHVTLPGAHPYRVRLAVDDARGVSPGRQEVRLAGVVVGRITGSDLVGGRPVLTLTIDRRYAPIYRDARVRLRPQTPLNDMYVDIEKRGHKSAGALGDMQTLSAQRTQVPVNIAEVLDVFDERNRTRMRAALDELGRGLPDHGADLRVAFGELVPFLDAARRMTQETADRRGLTRRLVHNLRLLTEELASRDGQLVRLVNTGDASLGTLAANDRSLSALIAELPPTLARLRHSFSTLRGTLDPLDSALVALDPTAGALEPGLRSLRSFALEARPALDALREPVRRLVPLATTLRPTAASLRRAFASLRPQAPRLDRVTARIVPCESAVQGFFQWTPSVFKLGDAHGAYPRGHSIQVSNLQLDKATSCADGARAR